MSILDVYILSEFKKEIEELGYNESVFDKDIWKFRFLCYKLNYFMKHIALPEIKKNSFYEAVFIEFRILPNIEFVIRNAIFRLGKEWSFTVICGKKNYLYISNIVKNVNKNIKIICLDYDNLSQEEYSNLLTTKEFWNALYGDKILIYQEDSLIFHNNILPFLKYDYIGAPFGKTTNDTPNCVGNGGLSLRTKSKMLEVINYIKLEDTKVNSSTESYMKMSNLKYPPEDVYFSKNMQECSIGDVADWNTAYQFSSEQVFNPNSFAGHKFWISNNFWITFVKTLFKYKKYLPKSNLNKYLSYQNQGAEYNKNKDIKNAFDIDFMFFCYVNNISYINDFSNIEYMSNIGLDGFIYHPKQLLNIFPNIKLYRFLNNIYTFHKNKIITIQGFVNKHLYNSSFDYLSNLLIKKKYDLLNDNYDTLLLVFLGNEKLAIELITVIAKYKSINKEFNIAFCINNSSVKNKSAIKNIIKKNFDFYAIYCTKELGTDITPTMLMYNDIVKRHSHKHILKFHTKSISTIYTTLTEYLLKTPLENVISNKIYNCNCIGHPSCYINILNDKFNNRLKTKYYTDLNLTNKFVGGTIFYAESIVFDKVLEFIKNNNYRSYLLNNLYENNSINQAFSPIHFLERLFGVIKL